MKNPKQNPDPNRFMFAWSQYNGPEPKATYYAVNEALEIFKSTDWPAFHKKTGLFCKRLRLYTEGYLTASPETEIYSHESYLLNFIRKEDTIELVGADEITFYDHTKEPEEQYRKAVNSYNERNAD